MYERIYLMKTNCQFMFDLIWFAVYTNAILIASFGGLLPKCYLHHFYIRISTYPTSKQFNDTTMS